MKRQRVNNEGEEEGGPPLIPGLPDHIAHLCLTRIHPSILFPVSHSWRRLIYSPSFPPFSSLYAILSPHNHHHPTIQFFNFDPISSHWHPLPPPPSHPSLHHLLLRHPSFLSRNLSIQSVSAAGSLVLLAGTTHNLFPALPRPVIFNPVTNSWALGPSLTTPRRWCAAGVCRGAVYVASGIGTHFSLNVARSMEKWDTQKNGSQWEKKTALKDGRFSREAIDAVGWKGKLCMVNVKGDAAKEGVVYDVEKDLWKEMPEGMLAGWRGPVAAMDEEVMFVVDEVKGVVRRYVEEQDSWEEVLEDERLKGAEQVSAEGGRVCVVCGGGGGGGGIFVVDVVARPRRIWVVELPEGFEAIAVHVLPRMPITDFSVKV
ncbi:F-box/kelch-repeat protein SKIP25-like [Arachis hypogaea]|uniref:F-box domain-containing protein n=1 Tax=Arachis hypogaea TaxID=3818 RepID=A0A444WVE2_ARAHY|nr:F-box/kelch-repeat protein SKIP25-like [Arachis hypogaea]XP_025698047.1 F-box/kelch-repeat protein SKIP25-like [Arachis hypogaea]QHO40162.1 F-box/kelch-repeat protein [Arachis hypogaea]RYQ81359.1 hypothetical protein Ahy_Scaffold1g107313 [Arachis hypogaea]